MTLSHQFEVKCGGMPQDAGTLAHQRKTPQFNNALNRIDQLNIPNQKLQRSIPMFAKEWEFPAVSAHSFPAPPSGLPLAPWGWLKGLALSAERSHGHGPWWPWCEAKSNPSWDGYGDLMDFNGDFNGVQ